MIAERFTLGVEEEYQLVDPATGELRSRAGLVRRADRSGEVDGEVQDTMLEIGTPVCNTAAEVAARLRERRFQASAAAAAEDLEVVAAGTHPFSVSRYQKLADDDRPRMLMGMFRQLLRQQHIWGMHVHVAIPGDIDRVVLMNTVRAFTPHLLALSCSSPYQLGEDTGFSSFRAIAWRGYPFAGVPPRFGSSAEYRTYLDHVVRSRIIHDEKTVYWSVRPSSGYPTLELRICDVCPRIADAVAIAALGRAMVVAAAEGMLTPLASSLSHSLQDEILNENEWVAARDGLDARLIAPEEATGGIPMREAIAELLDTVEPIVSGFGDSQEVLGVGEILSGGNAADRMRARYAGSGSLTEVVDWLIRETRVGTGIDRRTQNREELEIGSGTREGE